METLKGIRDLVITIAVLIIICFIIWFIAIPQKTQEEKVLSPQIKQLEEQIKTADELVKRKDEEIAELTNKLMAIEKKRTIGKQNIKSKIKNVLAEELTKQGF